jgi:glycosyltransferase involved in cell wall biosynthesis
MNVLIVSPLDVFPPSTGGMSRIYNIAKYLARRCRVTLASPRIGAPDTIDLPIDVHQLSEPGRSQFVDPRYMLALRALIRSVKPEVILSSFVWSAIPIALASAGTGIPLHIDTHNVESERFRRSGARAWRALALYERMALRLAERVYAVSESDRAMLLDLGAPAAKITIVPNGYDDERVHPDAEAGESMRRSLGLADDETVFLYFGHFRYGPNVEGLEIINRELLPRLDAHGANYRVVVAGRESEKQASRLRHPRLHYAGVVDRIEDAINASDAVVAPLLRGGGTRIKIIESIACGRTVVSTTEGAEGIDRAACGDLLRVVDGWDAFACAMASTGTQVRFEREPSAAFTETYAWSRIIDRMAIGHPKVTTLRGVS